MGVPRGPMYTRRSLLQTLAAAAAPPALDWTQVHNPAIDRGAVAVRDPAAIFHDGTLHVYCTIVEETADTYRLFVEHTTTTDLVHWTPFQRLTPAGPNFSSPGNVFRAGGRWRLCVQSYPIDPGQSYGNESSRLWLMDSPDLVHWSAPAPLRPEGCTAQWSKSHRQIDPYVVEHDGRYWCFYKANGRLGLLMSRDLKTWTEASPDRPVLGPETTPDGCTVENPCVVRDAGRFVLFFAPCRQGRGIGMAESDDLLHWRDIRYLDFPQLPWATGGPTAAAVLDLRRSHGRWLMLFHGEQAGYAHRAALGVAWSRELHRWECPGV